MSSSTHSAASLPGIFLSYAREDTDAARRIAEALRSSGLEVWFDQNELRGGDAWDQKIRRQIRDCALFVPIISQHTQVRGEGYFRLEWKLAVERMHLMAEGIPFLFPVVVDETPEDAGLVPEPFMRVQWTRLPSGLPTPQFVDQVRVLLQAPRTPPLVQRPATAPPHPVRTPRGGLPLWPFMAAAALLVAGLLYLRSRPWPAQAQPTAPVASAPKAAPAVADKSIAVLPFADMSENKDAGFFADGVHEDLLTTLALVPELKVISRTSVMQYRATTKTIKEIGRELGVAYVLEGSVRRAGNKVRVTGQLINTQTDEHVWAKNYDRDLTDLFGIQSALAQEIAGSLSAAISPETRKHIERRPTENTAAYDLFLQGRAINNSAPSGNAKALTEAATFFERACELDPKFASAWGELAVVYALKAFWNIDARAEIQAKGSEAIAKAESLEPDAPEVIRLIGTYAYYAHRDYVKATEQYLKLAAIQPNDPTVFSSLGLIQRRQGRWAESLANLRKAADLDSGNIGYQRSLLASLRVARRWDEAREIQERLVALRPGDLGELQALADLNYDETDSMLAAKAFIETLTPEQREDPDILFRRKFWASDSGDMAEFKRLDKRQPYEPDGSPMAGAIYAGLAYWGGGDLDLARARVAPFLAEARLLTVSNPENSLSWDDLGKIEVLSGQTEVGLSHLAKAVALMPISRDALVGPSIRFDYLSGCAMAGRIDEVLTGLDEFIHLPSGVPLTDVRHNPAFRPLRGNPRFESLVNDPHNNEPLF
jgi:TolB-like protein/Tfp pilus assembly protein PilF